MNYRAEKRLEHSGGYCSAINSRRSVRPSLDASIGVNYGKQRLKLPLQNTWSST